MEHLPKTVSVSASAPAVAGVSRPEWEGSLAGSDPETTFGNRYILLKPGSDMRAHGTKMVEEGCE